MEDKSGVDRVYVDDDFYFGFRGFRKLAYAFIAFRFGGDRDLQRVVYCS